MNAKSFEKWLKTLKIGESLKFRRGETVITFTRTYDGVMHSYGPGSMTYTATCRTAAEWFCEDDGKGSWSPVEMRLASL